MILRALVGRVPVGRGSRRPLLGVGAIRVELRVPAPEDGDRGLGLVEGRGLPVDLVLPDRNVRLPLGEDRFRESRGRRPPSRPRDRRVVRRSPRRAAPRAPRRPGSRRAAASPRAPSPSTVMSAAVRPGPKQKPFPASDQDPSSAELPGRSPRGPTPSGPRTTVRRAWARRGARMRCVWWMNRKWPKSAVFSQTSCV